MVRRQEVALLLRARGRAFFALIAIVLLFSPTTAAAHAVLVSSIPVQGERLSSSPKVLSLRFSEAVTRVDATLVDRSGGQIKLKTVVAGSDVKAELPGVLADGAYAFAWRIVSEDGHPVSASVVFSLGAGSGSDHFTTVDANAGWIAVATWAAKFIFYCATLLGVGGVFFSIVIAGTKPATATRSLLAVSGLSAGGLVALFCLEETGGDLAAMASVEAWLVGFDCSLAKSATLVSVSLGLAFGAGRVARGAIALSTMALVVLGPAFALTGHASGAGVQWLSFLAVSVHVIAVSFWAGALPGLWRILGPQTPGQAEALSRFSFAVPLSVAAMLGAGGYLAFVQVGVSSALWKTDYGMVLLLKLALVGTALALGTWNRLALTSRVVQGSSSATRSMKAVVSFEIVLIILVLAVTAVWRFTPPPRALALRAPVTASVHVHDIAAMATLTFDTTPDLRFDVNVSLTSGEFDPIDPREVTLRMSSSEGAIAPFDISLHRVSPGLWRAEHAQAPCDCDWNFRLGVLVSDFEILILDGEVKLLSGTRADL